MRQAMPPAALAGECATVLLGQYDMKLFLPHSLMLFWPVATLATFSQAASAQAPAVAMEGRMIQAVVVLGNYRTKDSVILRQLQSRPGTRLDRDVLRHDRLRLENMQIFSQVRLWPTQVANGVRLCVEVRERVPWLPFPVLYWSHDQGWTYGFGLACLNFRGRAEQLETYLAFGGAKVAGVGWFTPWVWNRIFLRIRAQGRRAYHRYCDFRPTTVSFAIEVGRPVSRHWRLSVEGRYATLESDKPAKTVSPDNTDVLPEFCGRIVYDSRDLHVNPHRGWLNALVVSRTGKWLNGTTEISSLNLDLRRYQPLWFGHTLAVGTEARIRSGTIPLYERIHLGGTETVRGWDWNSFQGDNALIGSLEYRFDLARRRIAYGTAPSGYVDRGLGGALFADTGAVWDTHRTLDRSHFHSGYGLGLRLFVPFFHVVRFDYAWNTLGEGRWQVNLYPKF